MVTVLWKDYPLLLSVLADLKTACRRNEQLTAKGYAGHDYRRGAFFSSTAAGRPAEGYSFFGFRFRFRILCCSVRASEVRRVSRKYC